MRVLALALICFNSALATAQGVRVGASVNANRIGLQDVLQLTVVIEGGTGEPQLPPIEGFRLYGRSTSSQVSIVGGRMTSTNSYIYQLLPEKEGRFTIGAITVNVSGEEHRTEPIEIEVVAGSVVPRGSGRGVSPFGSMSRRSRRAPSVDAGDVYLKAEVSKSSVYLGEEIIVTYRLYSSRYVPLGPQIEDDPPLTGFWAEEVGLDDSDTAKRQTIGGEPYLVFPLKRRILFPTKTGELEVPPLTLSTAFRLTSSDPFDSFFSPGFSRGSSPIVVRSAPVKVDVKALPSAGRSREFAGAVGEFELTAELNREEVKAGDAVTLTLSIAGRGNLRIIESPSLPDTPGFRTFDPKTDETIRASRRGLRGSKQWEYVLVPESGGAKEIGPWSFQYFDPAAGKYVDATAGPLTLRVSGSADGIATATSARGEVTLLRQDIRYLKEAPRTLGVPLTPYYGSTFFYLTLALPILWNLGLVVYVRQREKEKTHSTLFRSSRAHRMAQGRLKRAAKLAAEGSKDFYEEIAAALYKYVGDKKSVSPSGLTTSSIDALLEDGGAADETRAEFLAVLSQCEEARFTPGTRSSEEMETLRARTEALIVSVEKQLA